MRGNHWKKYSKSFLRWRIKGPRSCQRVSTWTRCDTSGTSNTSSRLTYSKESALICGCSTRLLRSAAISEMRINCPEGFLAVARTGAPVGEADLGRDSRPAESLRLERVLIKRAYRSLQSAGPIMPKQNLSVVLSLGAGKCLGWQQPVLLLWSSRSIAGCLTIECSN